MRVAVIGAGAIGGWLAAGCIEAGADMIVLARGASFDALKRDGLWLEDGKATKRYPVAVTKDPKELAGADILLLGLKAHDLPSAAPLIEAASGANTIFVPAINGLPWWFFNNFGGQAEGLRLETVDPGGILSKIMPVSRVVGTIVHAASHVTAPGKIRLDKANKVLLGDAGNGNHAGWVAEFMAHGAIPAETTDTLHWHVWNKLWGNSNMNPLSALARANVAQLLSDEHIRALVKTMMSEMSELGALVGLEGFDDPDERIAITRDLGPIRTSMLQDIEAGRQIEIDPILGGLVELARYLEHPTPAMNAVYGLVRLLDQNLRAQP